MLAAALWLLAIGHTYAQTPTIVGPTQVCVGDADSFWIAGGLPTGVRWDILQPPIPGTVLAIDEDQLTVRWHTPGTYVLRAEPNGSGPTAVLTIVISGGEVPLITSPDAQYCPDALCDYFCYEPPLSEGNVIVFNINTSDSVAWSATGAIVLNSTTGGSITGEPTGPGTFELTATVTDAAGCVTVAIYCGEILRAPALMIEAAGHDADQNIHVCRGETVDFTTDMTVGRLDRVEWRLSDGTIGGGGRFSPTFDTPGVYTVELYSAVYCGCFELVDVATVIVEPGEQFELICPEVVCAGETVVYQLDLDSGQGLYCQDVTWEFIGADSSTVQVLSPTSRRVTWPASGLTVGQVRLTPSAGCPGCPEPTVIEVPIIGGGPVDLQFGFGRCGTQTQSLFAPVIPGATYTWRQLPANSGLLTSFLEFNGGQTVQFKFADGAVGQALDLELTITYEAGGCSQVTVQRVAYAPTVRLSPVAPCIGQAVTLSLDPSVPGLTGGYDYSYGAMSGRWDFATNPTLVLGPVQAGASEITLSNLVVAGASYPCSRTYRFDATPVPAPLAIVGPLVVCPETPYLYGARVPVGFGGMVVWEVHGGHFDNGTTGAMGPSVVVTWDGSGSHVLIARLKSGDCVGSEIQIEPVPAEAVEVSLEGDANPCVDNATPAVYRLTCGTEGVACPFLRNVRWRIESQVGTIADGQGSSEVEIRWHLPLGADANTSLIVTYETCEGGEAELILPIKLQSPSEVEVTAEPTVACAGDAVTFRALGNPDLELTRVDWTVVDVAGQTYSTTLIGPDANGWDWDSDAALPEVAAGPARIYARVYYANCSFSDLGSTTFELVHNPIPALSALQGFEECDEHGQPIPAAVTFVTGNADGGPGAPTVTYTWERRCGAGGTWQVDTTTAVGTLTRTIDPVAGCSYRVRTARTYSGTSGISTCNRVSNDITPTWGCNGGDCGYDPLVLNVVNGGLDSTLGCGTVLATGAPGGDPVAMGLSFGAWWVVPNPTDPPLFTGPIESIDPTIIQTFSNVSHPFARFEQPTVYYLNYGIAGPASNGNVCSARAPVEITLVPEIRAEVTCGSGSSGTYGLRLDDRTEVIEGSHVQKWRWTVIDDAGQNLLQDTTETVVGTIPARAITYQAQVCLTVSGPTVRINPGQTYTCQKCVTVTVPGRPITEIATATDQICAGTAFTFSYIDPADPFAEFEWNFGDGTGSRLRNVVKVFAESGPKTVSLTYTNSIGCVSTSEVQIDVNEGEVDGRIDVALDPTCGTSAVLSAVDVQGQPDITYLWTPIATPSHESSISVNQSGAYGLAIVDGLGCRYDAPEVSVVLQEPFPGEVSFPASVCAGGGFEILRVDQNPVFKYFFSIDGGAGSFVPPNNRQYPIYPQALAPGAHTLTVTARNPTGVICATETIAFEVLAAPAAPVIELTGAICEPSVRLTYRTVDGSSVDWFVGSIFQGRGPTVEVPASRVGDFVRATVDGAFCTSAASNELQVPNSANPNIVTGCFTDCDDLPTDLRDLSGGTYASWEWVFIPEGDTVPTNCPNQPGPGTGTVVPWADFYCGDGDYFLRVTSTFAGVTCELTSDVLCINCEVPAACTPPEWLATNMACLAAVGGTDYYINFDTPMATSSGGAVPCGPGSVSVTNGTIIGTLTVSREGSASNIEGRIRVASGTPLSSVCVDIPYCDDAGQSCGSEQICLSEATEGMSNCPTVCAGSDISYGGVEWRCPSDQGSDGKYLTEISLTNVVITTPTGCTPGGVGFHQVAGMIGTRGAGWNNPAGTGGGSLGATLVNGQYVLPELSFEYVTYPNQRQACFKAEFYGCVDSLGTKCAVTLCVDIPLGCYPPNENPVETPLVECETGAEGLQNYTVWVPLGPGQSLPANAAVLGLSSGGTGTVVGSAPDYVRLTIQVPAGSRSAWLVLGDSSQSRAMRTLHGVNSSSGVPMPVPLPGDIVRHLILPTCAPSGGNGEGESAPLPLMVDLGGRASELRAFPNPARSLVTVHLEGGDAAAEVDWKTVRLYGIDGGLREFRYAGESRSREAVLQIGTLAPGSYFVTARSTTGEPLGCRFVKQ